MVAKQLDIARSEIQPSLGATVYDFGRQAIETQPQGDNAPFNQLLLQAPGVAQDSFGQLHVRGDHANLQFRINGVQLPEGINVFGQTLQTRLANSVALITGALPAQYGLRTAGVIDIQTKTGTLNPGGSVTMYGGSQSTIYPSAEWGGRVGQIDYYATGEYLQNAEGIENPAPTFNAIHDNSQQPKGFAYVSGIIDPTSRLTAILGASRGQFQIPQVGGQTPEPRAHRQRHQRLRLGLLNENQRQINNFGILAWQKRVGDFDFQVAGIQPIQQRLLLARRPDRRPAVQRHRPDRLPPELGERRAGRRQLARLVPSTRCAAAFWSSASARRSAPRQTSCRSTTRRADHRPADLDLRFRQQDRMALQLLPAGRMEDHSVGHDQFRRPVSTSSLNSSASGS